MSNQKQWGFTIIELILFLGITGALFAGLMVGVNTSINTQRYKQSAASFKSALEEQYAEVTYPRNARDSSWACSAEAGIVSDPSNGTTRGTSQCVLLGRFIEVEKDGTTIKTGDVVGIDPGVGTETVSSDIDILKAYTPRVSPINVSETEVGWQSHLEYPENGVSKASYLILRSPLSGIIRTFGSADPLPDQLTNMLTTSHATAVIKNCVVPAGYISIPVQSVTVNAAVGSANGVVLEGNDSEC